ncbi:MAG: translation initiation factor IF-1 [Dehalococcoidia bacterium]|nr:MAG: translation initiation factor IF-1 [Dehalococcoidia bacterium]
MAKKEAIEVEGLVNEALPNAFFKIELPQWSRSSGPCVGKKFEKNFIRILPGDKVLVELSTYDLTAGRIPYRFK